jgi:putative FmdB family regulatory protein
MPLYEYECDACGRRFEVIRKFSDPPLEACTLCQKGPVRRLQSSPAIQFKGTGWYITDYAQKGKTGTTDQSGAGKGEAQATDTKGGDAKGSDAKSGSTTSSSGAPSSSSPTKAASGDS